MAQSKEILYGKDTAILVNKLADGNYLALLSSRTCSIQLQSDFIETSDVSSGNFKDFTPTFISGTMSGDGLVRIDDTMTSFDLLTFFLNKTQFGVTFAAINNAGSKRYIMANAYVSSLSKTAGYNDAVNYSYQLQLTGLVSVQTSLAGGGGGSTTTANDLEIINFSGVSTLSLSWTTNRKNRFGQFPVVEVWIIDPTGVYYLTSVQPTLDGPPPSFTTMNFDFGASSTGFVIIK